MEITESDKKRFWAKVDKNGPIMPGMGTVCWEWMAAKSQEGYGRFKSKYKWYQAHHFSWVMHNHAIPRKSYVYQKCKNKLCVNPDHLFMDDESRFWRDVNKDGPIMPHMDTPCWIWTADTTRGYGTFHPQRQKKVIYSHRYSWILHNGSIPEGDGPHGTCVCHECDNSVCVNPQHLFLGSAGDNVRDMFKKNNPGHNGRAKLTNEQVKEIRELYATGQYTHKRLAQMFNLDRSHIGSIVNYECWKHL